ncbi:hypothetical protein, partial [Thiococcus pfennigii]
HVGVGHPFEQPDDVAVISLELAPHPEEFDGEQALQLFLVRWIEDQHLQSEIRASGSEFPFPAPSPNIAEQRRIVAKVDQLMALVDQLEAQLNASRATAANLLSALDAKLTTA